MRRMTRTHPFGLAALLVIALNAPASSAPRRTSTRSASASAVLWRDPVNITRRDLRYGPGGRKHQPQGPFRFVKEDLKGSNVKFVVTGADGVKWTIKLGEEAHPETAASRILWAAGYFADEEYFLPDVRVEGMPLNLHRGADKVGPDGVMHNARLKRHRKGGESGIWRWKDNPFTGTREFNGLRVMMALINNWDLKDVNNAVYKADGRQVYLVSDLGASFGTNNRSVTQTASKGNLDHYTESKFITGVTPVAVDFAVPGRPAFIHAIEIGEFKSRVGMEWIGKNIPIGDVRWIGSILARLSPAQIHAAFDAAGYSSNEATGFSSVLETRIGDLNRL